METRKFLGTWTTFTCVRSSRKCPLLMLVLLTEMLPYCSLRGSRVIQPSTRMHPRLRFASNIPLSLPHWTESDTTLGGYFVPKDCLVSRVNLPKRALFACDIRCSPINGRSITTRARSPNRTSSVLVDSFNRTAVMTASWPSRYR